ncbi:uncharacterized protein [Anabrus simplex]|uniref:uncharacterized protein isoform X2 n=1 Tax=Anabrus simplex TaxID=316456 RepID=UPI0035A2EA37
MESIFNIFGSQQEAVKLQKPVSSSGTFLDVGPLKQRAKSDSSNVYSKKVLGDIRNTLQTNKKVDSDENGPIKGKMGEDSAFAGCSRTPLLPKSQGVPKTVHKVFEKSLKNQTPAPKKYLEVPKTVHKLPNHKTKGKSTLKSGTPSLKTSKFSPVFREMVTGSPELQGPCPETEDSYEDIWSSTERPSLRDYGKIMEFWDDNTQPSMVQSPQIPELLKGTALNTNIDFLSDLAKLCETEVSSADPQLEIQGPAPFNEDNYEDIWSPSERPLLRDYGNIWDVSKYPHMVESPQIPELVKGIDSLSDLAKLCEMKVSSADPEPEIQGPAPFNEDSYEDVLPVRELPVLDDFKRIMVFWDTNKQPAELEHISVPEPEKDGTIDLDINLVLPLVQDVDMNVMAVPYPAVEEA